MVLATMALFVAALAANEWLFSQSEFARGINWIYLPAGVRLLATLLFAGAGALGLLLVSSIVSAIYFFPDDPGRAFVGGILAALAPYLVYLAAQKAYGLHASLANLTPNRLLLLIVAYSIASPLLHHLWFMAQGQDDLAASFIAMVTGDLVGTLLVIYTVKGVLSLVARRRGKRDTPATGTG